MSEVTIWHNPRCSKSRQTLELLRSKGIEPEIREYLKDPPSAEELTHVLALLGMKAQELIRRKEAEYSELGLAPHMGDGALIAAMVEHPKLIERPVVIKGERAVLGRPPENVLGLL